MSQTHSCTHLLDKSIKNRYFSCQLPFPLAQAKVLSWDSLGWSGLLKGFFFDKSQRLAMIAEIL